LTAKQAQPFATALPSNRHLKCHSKQKEKLMQKRRNILLEAVVLALLVTTAAVSLGQITVGAQKQACDDSA
jgi:hypothetical protein